MNQKSPYMILASLLISSIILSYGFLGVEPANEEPQNLFVGIDVAYENRIEIKTLIDKVSPYTNLFVIGWTGITNVYVRENTTRRIVENFTALNETCQYLYDKGLNFMVFRDTGLRNSTWSEIAKKTWGDSFLGYYAFDELGGYQLDQHEYRLVLDAKNYSDAAKSFVSMTGWYLNRFTRFRNTTGFNLYTSDYGFYWFDYESGYDTVFAEFGWNYSRQLNIAQCRGAANMHGKDWGAIITWTYTQPPYLESGAELYKDLVLAYENGAKYTILFDANEGWTQSVPKPEHFGALKRFWEYVKQNPRQTTQAGDRVAYVLPKDYGYGFRGPDDKIWGFWQADNLTSKVCANLNYLLTEYDKKLDIVYDFNLLPGNTYGYSKLFYWNDSSLPQLSKPPTLPSISPEPLQLPTETATPVIIENPQPPMDYVPVAAIGAVLAVVAVPAYLLRKREYNITFASSGIGRDYAGSVFVVDGENHDKYGASFWWGSGSRHTYEFKSKIEVSRSKQYVKSYVLVSTTGLGSDQYGSLSVSRSASVTGNYRPVFEVLRTS